MGSRSSPVGLGVRARWIITIPLAILLLHAPLPTFQQTTIPVPNLLLSAGSDYISQLQILASSYTAAPAGLRGAFEALDLRANQALKRTPVSVADKADPAITAGLGVDWTTWATNVAGPSAQAGLTKNDYLTLCTYCWPVADKPTAPWKNIDGKVNPLGQSFPDNKNWNTFQATVLALSHRYYAARYFPNITAPGSKVVPAENYAQVAVAFIKAWYTDPDTGMTPRLTYAQYRPNSNSFTGTGIIDFSAKYAPLLDAFTLLSNSPSWTPDLSTSMKTWHTQLLTWLTTDPIGLSVGARLNNHVVWYDGMVSAIATWIGNTATVEQFRARAGELVGMQVTPTGVQFREEVRVGAWNYSSYNLLALTRLYATLDNPLNTPSPYIPGSNPLWRAVSDGLNYTSRYGGDAYNPAGMPTQGPPGASYTGIISYLSAQVMNPAGWAAAHSGVSNGTAYSDRVQCSEWFAEVVRRAYWTVGQGDPMYRMVLETCLGGTGNDSAMADPTATWDGWIRVGEPWWRLREPLGVLALSVGGAGSPNTNAGATGTVAGTKTAAAAAKASATATVTNNGSLSASGAGGRTYAGGATGRRWRWEHEGGVVTMAASFCMFAALIL